MIETLLGEEFSTQLTFCLQFAIATISRKYLSSKKKNYLVVSIRVKLTRHRKARFYTFLTYIFNRKKLPSTFLFHGKIICKKVKQIK